MFNTLHGRLSLALLALLIPVGVFYVLSTVATSRRYAQEVSQEVSAGLAARLVRDTELMVGRDVAAGALEAVVETLAMTNPDVDLYVLGADGEIVGSSLALERLELRRVSLAPLETFLSGTAAYPILGDNPRARAQPKVFSVAAIPGAPGGYLYIVLADEVQDTVAAMVESSTIVRLSIWTGLALLTLVFLAGTLIFTLFTRRLKRLAASMMAFQAEDFAGSALAKTPVPTAGDEVDDLNRVFHAMAARLAEQVAGLRESDRLRRELVANVSHDLRTPLTALQGYLETLQLQTLTPEEKRRYLELATKHSVRLGALVGELFELAKLEAAAAAVYRELFPLAELVQDVVQKFELGAQQRGVTLRAEVSVYPVVDADVGFLERVLENLLDNALKHTPVGGTVTLSLTPAPGGVTVAVTDTGAGISPHELPYILERYYRASRTGRAQEKPAGAGLGLAISQRMLELHGSGLAIVSEVGVGTTVTFTLVSGRGLAPTVAEPQGSEPT